MSFENGKNMFDYCGAIFKKYHQDKMIFFKALQLLDYFRGREDYPYCTEELSQVLERILGENLTNLSDVTWKYTIGLSADMKWDIKNALNTDLVEGINSDEIDELAQNFKNDMESFFIATTPFFEELFMGESNTTRLKKIALKQTYGEEKTVRFIRKDGEVFDFSVSKKDIENIISVFSDMK